MDDDGGKKAKSGGSSFDIFFVVGIVLALGLMVFGISFNAAPQREKYESDEAYNEAVVEYDEAGGVFRPQTITQSFIDVPSLIITVGGTFASLMITYPLSVWANVPKYFKIAVLPPKYDTDAYIAQISDFAKEARVKGLLSLEDKLNTTEDAFLKSSLMLVVDSVEPEKVHNLLEAELEKLDDRHQIGKGFFENGGAYAPGFGMIGTLIGLVNMLKDMSDPSAIGPSMAVALLTTLYGSMLANIIFSPMAVKLGLRNDEELLCKQLIAEGVEGIQAGENPKFIEEKLNLLVRQKKGKKAKSGGDE